MKNIAGIAAFVVGVVLAGATAFGVVQSQSSTPDAEAGAEPVVVNYGN